MTEASQAHLLDAVGQFGVILLVGTTALEIGLALVRRTRRTSLTVGAFGLLIPLGLVGVVDDVTGWMLLIRFCAVLLGRPVVRWLMARARSPQAVMGTATVVIVGCAAATQA
ncbi:hypothetical protein IM697_42670 [Streptomyces ferrugineus]|uniref:Uncharacterized protein n=1 Tax=Streptomyces ferrugineus TaxID=1413221 RepID=A0A7M2SJS7_9ACTN|nr:hypothetical protein [Streptomyces ferrugineus]QOV36610.1 hypothetical protein IM697_42670 [Streptomyces ferrugineus]